ncbi:CdaR family transcriptional regulator [Arthrobacter sp. AZCC_0090]|uniref:PucR family transcriptional regulator n=1 Tax=Arthrobacter sp. AZCC_0090 TaxID=2735881 RepID=UPI00161735FE|nr:helix-turn-helix domain-containing protein [Arthrobacter sp. AZCC_0090]MBB6406045.1 sugar diacid utilization regulator [Arthrobacter sp. AZCC_0090]
MIPPLPLWYVTNHLPAGVIEWVGGPGANTVSSLVALTGSVAEVNRQVREQRNLDGDPLNFQDCILLPLEPLPSGVSWDVEALLALASSAGVVALAVKLPHDVGAVPPNIKRLAERLGLVVLAVHNTWQFGVAAQELLSGAAHLLGLLVSRVASECRTPYGSLTHLLSRLTHALGHQVTLVDPSGKLISAEESLQERGQQPEASTLPDTTEILAAVYKEQDNSPRLRVVLGPVLAQEQAAIGAALAVAAIAVSELLSRQRLERERDARHRIALLGQLIDSAGDVSPSFRARALELGWTLDGYHMAFRVIAREPVDIVARKADLDRALLREKLEAATVEQSDGWSGWITFPSKPGPADVGKISSALRRAQRELAVTISTQFGVGRMQAQPEGIVRSLEEANDAARIAAARESSGYFVHVDRLDMAQLLLIWTRTDTFRPAARELLAPLLSAGPELLLTLTTFLDCESSLTETAAILNVHRNTVSDRIRRIQSLIAINLGDPEARLALQLACRSLLMDKPE